MEFKDMQKIWDTQNDVPLYAIDEAALYKRILAKSKRASRVANMNEIGLTLIMLSLSVLLIIIDRSSMYAYVSALMMFLIAVYVWVGRIRRKQREQTFDRSMLGELDMAIANVDNEVNRARTFVWWMILPAGLPVLLNMIQAGVVFWKWLIIPASYALAYALVQWELRRCHLPRKQELEILREKLEE